MRGSATGLAARFRALSKQQGRAAAPKEGNVQFQITSASFGLLIGEVPSKQPQNLTEIIPLMFKSPFNHAQGQQSCCLHELCWMQPFCVAFRLGRGVK